MIAVNSKGTANKIPTQKSTSQTYSAKRKFKFTAGGKIWAKIIGIMLIFLVGVGMGHSQGIKDAGHTPDPTTMGILHYAQSMGAKGCRAEWNPAYSSYEVVCAQPVQITNLDADHDPQK
jgi:hypothetical protein